MLPGLDGIGLCRRIRETSTDPILMMSARGDALDVVSGLEAGADDYVVKPVDTAVLVARIRSLLRRASFAPAARPDGLDPSTDSNQRRQQDQYARLVFGGPGHRHRRPGGVPGRSADCPRSQQPQTGRRCAAVAVDDGTGDAVTWQPDR
jgi:DNA-binding response OmpR family regulator